MRFWVSFLLLLAFSLVFAIEDAEFLENKLAKENLSNKEKMEIFNQLAMEYAKSNRIKADSYAQQALIISEELDDKKHKALAILNKGLIAFHKAEFSECIKFSQEALDISKESNLYDIRHKIYYYLSSSYAAIQDYQKAYHFYKLYSSYIFDNESNSDIDEISDLTRRFEREHEHQKLKKENFDQKVSLQREKSVKQFLLIVIILIVAIVFIAFQQYREKNRLITELSNKNKEIADKNWEINEQKNQLIKQNQILQMIIDNIPNPISYKDINGKYLGCNQYYELYSGKTFKEIEGKTAFDVFPEDVASKIFEEDDDIIKNPRIISYEIDVVTTQVERQQVLVNKAPFYDMNKNVAGVIATIYDISDIKKAEQALLDSEHKLLLATTEKNQFLNIIANDMKDPLTRIFTISKDLYNSYKDINANKRKAIVKEIQKKSEFLLQSLVNLITWSKSQEGSLVFNAEKCDLLSIIKEEIVAFQAEAKSENITLVSNLRKKTFIMADKNLIKIAVRNIISQISGVINEQSIINLILERESKTELAFAINIDSEKISKKFITDLYNAEHNKISQFSNDEEKIDLGVVIIKDIITKSNGRITVDEATSKTTQIRLILPEWKA